jgi:hypothetical protein
MPKRHTHLPAETPVASEDRPLTIGWKEYMDFTAWGVRRVKVKIDTGARTSALGVVSYDLHEEGPGLMVDLRLALHRKHPERLTLVRASVLRMIVVSNSGGMREQRPLIEAEVRLGPITKRIALTVTNRAGMLFGVILGRKALEGDFVVDVRRRYVLKGMQP